MILKLVQAFGLFISLTTANAQIGAGMGLGGNAPSAIGQVQFLGAADSGCDQYIQYVKSNSEDVLVAFWSWGQGYASAASAINGKPLFADAAASLAFMRTNVEKECVSQPSQKYGQAVDSALQKLFKGA